MTPAGSGVTEGGCPPITRFVGRDGQPVTVRPTFYFVNEPTASTAETIATFTLEDDSQVPLRIENHAILDEVFVPVITKPDPRFYH